MNNTINNSLSFKSTYIPRNSKRPILNYLDKLDSSFELKGFYNSSVKKTRDKIDLGQAGVCFDKQDLVFVGKDKASDNFIYRQLAKIDNNIRYVDDAPEEKVNPNSIKFMLEI